VITDPYLGEENAPREDPVEVNDLIRKTITLTARRNEQRFNVELDTELAEELSLVVQIVCYFSRYC